MAEPSAEVSAAVESGDVVIQRVGQGVKGDTVPAMLRPAIQHEDAAVHGQARQLSEQPGLADPRIAGHLDNLR